MNGRYVLFTKEVVDTLYISDELQYEEAKHNLCLRLVNGEHNRKTLSALPHICFDDLAAVFLYMPAPCGDSRNKRGWGPAPAAEPADAKPDGDESAQGPSEDSASCKPDREVPVKERIICWQDVKRWDVTTDQLLRDAQMSSARMRPAFFAPMRQILGLPPESEEGEIPMYVLSCIDARFGASVLLYPDVIPEAAEKLEDDLYIIPSSVHELLILRAADVEEPQGLIDMIREVNRTEVSPGEILSDSLYLYLRKTGVIRRITKE